MRGATGSSAADGRPRLETPKLLSPWYSIGLTAVVAAVTTFATIGYLFVLTGDAGTARVLGPVAGTEQTRIEVLDGPEPGAVWRVPTADLDGARPGQVVDVTLTGGCDCVPRAQVEPLPMVVPVVAGAALAFLGVQLVRFPGKRRIRLGQAASARALATGVPAALVAVEASFSGRGRKLFVSLDLRTLDGALLGHVELRRLVPSFRPDRRFWLIGAPSAGSGVALVAEDGRAVLLPSSALAAGPASPAPWSQAAIAVVGWDVPVAEPDELSVLPTTGRVSMSGQPAERPSTEDVAEANRAFVVTSALSALLPVVLVLVAFVLGPPVDVVLLVVATAWLIGYRWVVRHQARRAAVRLCGLLGIPGGDVVVVPEVAIAALSWRRQTNAVGPVWTKPLPAIVQVPSPGEAASSAVPGAGPPPPPPG